MPKQKNRKFLVIFLAVILVIITGLFFYARVLQVRLSNSACATLSEVLQQQKLTFVAKFEGETALLETVAAEFSAHFNSFEDLPAVAKALNNITEKTTFSYLSIVGPNGRGMENTGRLVEVGQREYFAMAMAGKTHISSPLNSQITGQPVIVIATPVYAKGKVAAVLAGILEIGELDGLFPASFGGRGFAGVATSAGDIIVKTQTELLQPGANILTTIGNARIVKHDSIKQIQENVKKGLGGHTQFISNGRWMMAHYEPLGINDWYVISVADYNVVASEMAQILFDTVLVAVVVGLLFIGVFVLYLIEQKKIYGQLKEMDKRVQMMFNTSPLGCAMWNESNEVIDCNEAMVRMFGTRDKEEYLSHFYSLSPKYQPGGGRSSKMAKQALQQAFQSGYKRFEWMHTTMNGQQLPCEVTLIRLENNGENVLAGYCRDMREQKAMLAEIDTMLKSAEMDERCFRQLAAHTKTAVVEWKYGLKKTRIYKSYEELFAAAREEKKDYNDMIGTEMIHPEDRETHRQFLQKVMQGNKVAPIKIRLRCQNGAYRWCYHPTLAVQDEAGRAYKMIGFFEDIEETVLKERAMRQKLEMDGLTGLYNKAAVQLLVEETLEAIDGEKQHAVICVDIDNFKNINDSFGHLYGDEVLQELAEKIKGLFRSSDILGRFGGDEFILFIKDLPSLEFVHSKAEQLCKSIHASYQVGEVEHSISASIGISVYPSDGVSYTQLYTKADEASYRVKKNGKNGYAFYGEAISPQEGEGAL